MSITKIYTCIISVLRHVFRRLDFNSDFDSQNEQCI